MCGKNDANYTHPSGARYCMECAASHTLALSNLKEELKPPKRFKPMKRPAWAKDLNL
jgi:hypothetical protein